MEYSILDEFLVKFAYQHCLYNAIIKNVNYRDFKKYQTFKVDYTCEADSTKGTIMHLTFNEESLEWDDEDCSDKELCKVVGRRILAYYYAMFLLKQQGKE